MRKLSGFALALAAVGLFSGCGAKLNQSLEDAAPTFDTLSVDMESGDASPSQQAVATPDCHPHLFARTRAVVHRLNTHILKAIAKADAIVDKHPKASTGTSETWEKAVGQVVVKRTITKVTDTQFTFETDVKPASGGDYVKVSSGTINKSATGQPHTGNGTATIDLTALSGVTKEKAQGTITVNFNVSDDAQTKTLQIALASFTPDDGNPDISPKDANYVFQRTNGKGGSFKFQDQMVFLCPSNPQASPATVSTVARWSKNSSGNLVARADSMASGGQIASGDKIEGVTCADMSQPDASAEKYWMMKAEDGSGNTVAGSAHQNSVDGPSTCDSVFGTTVPTLDGSANDYGFASINFTDGSVVAYPGQPSTAPTSASSGS